MVLYSFRRCPYAMRARLAIVYALPVASLELREVVLKDKPQAMLDISPKGTVPVLHLDNGNDTPQVIDESLDIMLWAIEQNADLKCSWLGSDHVNEIQALIASNDGDFKWALDHYKYADRFEQSAEYYREKAEVFLAALEIRLQKHTYLMGDEMTLADVAIFPFVRQFAHVDRDWFFASDYKALQAWLNTWLDSNHFKAIMKKYPKWTTEQEPHYFPGENSQD